MNSNLMKMMIKLNHDLAIADLRLQNIEAKKIKITYNDMLYLNIIEARSGEYTATKIADLLQVSRPYVTQKINELEKRGYISKKQDPNDKRIYYLIMQEDALPENYNQSFNEISDIIITKLSQHFSKESIKDFLTMLDIMGDTLLEESEKYLK